MQSQFDADYIEYQILLAKAANIDGFFVEWGFKEHTSNTQLKLIQQIAQKYNFKVGVNWCDAWAFYNWRSSYNPSIVTREDKVDACIEDVQYLIDNVFNTETGILYDGHPIIYIFGGGFTPKEFEKVKNYSYKIPNGLKEPWFFRRAPINGKEQSGEVTFSFNSSEWHSLSKGSPLVEGPFGWMPSRVRPGTGSQYDLWDRYASKEDTIGYLKALKQYFSDNESNIKLKNSVVAPGMDNRGCAGWGEDLSYIPRENGETYRGMWEYNVKNRNDFDNVYIASWNDYNEGHQIEPTLQDGDREIRTTEEYAAQFKGVKSNPNGISLPKEIFDLRKKADFFNKTGVSISELTNKLDVAALAISRGEYDLAASAISDAKAISNKLESSLKSENIKIDIPSDKISTFLPNINIVPNISILTPTNGKSFLPGEEVNIKVMASDTDGDISKVEFYKDGVVLPQEGVTHIGGKEYIYKLQGLEIGNYIITAKAYDNSGAESTSQAVNISVCPELINVALNKKVKASSEISDSKADYAVDGVISDDLRWRTSNNKENLWLEIDLEKEYDIVGANYVTGYSNNGWSVNSMKLQTWDGSSWVDIEGSSVENNKKVDVSVMFTKPIRTNKVRFYSNDINRGVRVRGIKVFLTLSIAMTVRKVLEYIKILLDFMEKPMVIIQ